MAMTGLLYSIPLITIGAASMFGWMLAYLRGPAVVSEWIASAAGNDPFMIMLLLVVLFVIVGDFIDAIPAIIIFMPIITDLTKNADINPVHMGVVIIVTLAFGLITPPYGLCLLMASKFIGVRFGKAMIASLPIYIVFFAAIAFCIFFPEVVLWLPKTTAAGIGRLLQESQRRRLYLPLAAQTRLKRAQNRRPRRLLTYLKLRPSPCAINIIETEQS